MVSTLKLTSLLILYFITLTVLIALISPVIEAGDPLAGSENLTSTNIDTSDLNVTNTPNTAGVWEVGRAIENVFKFFSFRLNLGISGMGMFVIQVFFVYLPLLLFLLCVYFGVRSGN